MWWFDRQALNAAALVAVLGIGLGACGFHPLYADRAGGTEVTAALANVSVAGPDDRVGRELRFNLEDMMNARGNAGTRFRLALSPRIIESNIAIQQDTDVTRRNVRMTTEFSLYDQQSGETVYSGESVSISSYNRVDSQFANLSASRSAQERVAKEAARDIYTRISIFFERKHGS